MIKKLKKENEYEFNYWCNRDKIDKMTEKIENNWKVIQFFYKVIFAIFLLFLFFRLSTFCFFRVTFTVTLNINKSIYIQTKYFMASGYTHCKSKRVRRTFTLFLQRKQKKCGFCDNYHNCIHCKKLKYIRQCLDNVYYFSPRKDAPWQPTHWKVFYIIKLMKNLKIFKNLILIFAQK